MVEHLKTDMSLTDFEAVLADTDLPLERWGTGAAKTTANLHTELSEGESTMWIDDNSTLQRRVAVLWLEVLHIDEQGTVHLLREDRQEFKDGRTRQRTLPASLGEKLKPDETPELAVPRALSEELGVLAVSGHYDIGHDFKRFAPDTYPGLVSDYNSWTRLVTLPPEQFNPAGYVEYQADKTNYYVWDIIHRP